MPDSPDPAAGRRALVLGLAQALELLGRRMAPHAAAAAEVAALAARAEEIAEAARLVSRGHGAGATMARELAEFIAETQAVAARAAHSAAASREVGALMDHHAGTLTTLLDDPAASADLTRLRAGLRPLVGALESVQLRLGEGGMVADDIATLGARAGDLAQRKSGQTAGEAAAAISQRLRRFAEEAAAAADTMRAESVAMRAGLNSVARATVTIATGVATAPDTATSRMDTTLRQGTRLSTAVSWRG
jgi:hypothetical protein